MKRKLQLLAGILMMTLGANAQEPCSTGRYSSDVYSTVTTTPDIVYGQNTTFTGANKILKLDFYQPQGDTATRRPLIIWVHSGSFQAGSKTDQDMVDLSTAFAKKGYACASIDYRLGFFPIDSANSVKAVVRAVQDLRAAVRFFYKDAADNINTYKIDTNNIFIGGSSAGAITALHMAYLDRTCEINDYLSPTTIQTLGGLEGNSGNACYSDDIKGVINLCGALARYGWLEQGDVPLCSMHGTADGTVKYSRGMVNPGVPLMYLDGSRMLDQQAQAVGVTTNFYTFYNADHDPFMGTSATAQAYMDTTINFVRDFLIQQLGCTNPALQAENTPFGAATLYTFTTCTGNVPYDWCTASGIEEQGIPSVKIYPNPAQLSLNLEFEDAEERMIGLYDLSGRMITSELSHGTSYMLNNNAGLKGMYLLTITDRKGNASVHQIIFE